MPDIVAEVEQQVSSYRSHGVFIIGCETVETLYIDHCTKLIDEIKRLRRALSHERSVNIVNTNKNYYRSS